ncbi:hypothetical protein [Micromonospora echinofusca]|uniref:hypothetical protein n=1 Tax=Micromonospora echinofusca TaxID=47858 RepID=UPI0033CA251A
MPLYLASDHAWHHLEWFEWIGLGLGVVGFPLTLWGLWLTWQQATEANTAARAAQEAIRRTQGQLRSNQLMVMIPQLRWIASELDAAIDFESVPLTRRFLENWRSYAGQAQGLLSKTDPDRGDLLIQISESISLAASADASLFSKTGSVILTKSCAKARAAIREACDGLHVWLGENSTQVQDEAEGS